MCITKARGPILLPCGTPPLILTGSDSVFSNFVTCDLPCKNDAKTDYPRRLTAMRLSRVVDLLLISVDERQHYCVIKSNSRLLSMQTSKHKGKKWFCDYCLNGF